MSDLFIANLSKQHHIFIYTVPEGDASSSDKLRSLQRHENIPIGAQARLPGDLTAAQKSAIIEHHRCYGMKSWDEARKIKGFTGLCYRIGDTVPMNDQGFLDDVSKSNGQTLNDAGDLRREVTAGALSKELEKAGVESRNPLHRVQLEQIEDTDGTPRVASGVEIPSRGIAPRNQGTRRGA